MQAMIAMSGGVDSSVAALLALEQGYRCIGATLHLHDKNGAADADAVARRLGIPFHAFDAMEQFDRLVKDHFLQCYEQGLTPNPCIRCNRYLKFGHLLDLALGMGCDKLVTGHYARICQESATGRYLLKKAADPAKDQSYFLSCMNQHQLSHSLFPLGELPKTEVRRIAQDNGFLNAKKKDSQDICFVPDGDYMTFLERYSGKQYPAGDFLDQSGTVVGRHRGAVAYTLGQRKGLGLAMGQPVYVCGKNMAENTVTVSTEESLFHRGLLANEWNWISMDAPSAPLRVKAKARSRMQEQDATVYPGENGVCQVIFDEPQRAITPGQTVALYQGDTVVGGGIIIGAFHP